MTHQVKTSDGHGPVSSFKYYFNLSHSLKFFTMEVISVTHLFMAIDDGGTICSFTIM
jgi:hypothetical protein